jgi:hypothetical protein
MSMTHKATGLYNTRVVSTQTNLVEMREEVARMGEEIYEHLKSALEPDHNGRLVAIHIPSQRYFLGDTLLEASHHLRERYPRAGRGEVYTRGIGQRVVISVHTPRISGDAE